MKEFDVDRALGNTPAAFSHAVQAALQSCQADAPAPEKAHRGRKLTLALVIALILMLFTGTAYAIARAGGFLWFTDNYIGYWESYYPETFAHLKAHLQSDVPNEDIRENDLAALSVDDVAWIWDEAAVFCLHAVSLDPNVEIHDAMEWNVDGESEFALWTANGFGHPQDVMYDPAKQLVLVDMDFWNLTVGSPDGPALLLARSAYTTPEDDLLIYMELRPREYSADAIRAEHERLLSEMTAEERVDYDRNGFAASWKNNEGRTAALEAAIRADLADDGRVTLYIPYTLDYVSWDRNDPENPAQWQFLRDQPGGMLRFEVRVD